MKTIDAHTHYALPLDAADVVAVLDAVGTHRANLATVLNRQRVSCVPEALMAKSRYPDRFYVFASLDPSKYFISKNSLGKAFAKYARDMRLAGCDGIKMLEGKPQIRGILPIPDFDAEVWEPFFSYAEQTELPILWHVNDPEEFWDSAAVPEWAVEKGWFYDDKFINNERQYEQVLNVLARHPKLAVTFAHFFFMSRQLPRLSKILDSYENVRIDLAPGIELFTNLSENIAAARAFFEKHQDRILFGTDIGVRCVLEEETGDLSLDESRDRTELVKSFLQSKTPFTVKQDGGYLIGNDDLIINGLGLSPEIQDKIFYKNFERFVGGEPKAVSPALAYREAKRIKRTIKIMSLFSKDMTPDCAYTDQTIDYFKRLK